MDPVTAFRKVFAEEKTARDCVRTAFRLVAKFPAKDHSLLLDVVLEELAKRHLAATDAAAALADRIAKT